MHTIYQVKKNTAPKQLDQTARFAPKVPFPAAKLLESVKSNDLLKTSEIISHTDGANKPYIDSTT